MEEEGQVTKEQVPDGKVTEGRRLFAAIQLGLTAILVFLKVSGVLHSSWVLILSPLWLPLGLIISLIILFFAIVLVILILVLLIVILTVVSSAIAWIVSAITSI